MQHLVTLQKGSQPIVVPYLCTEDYDFEGFSMYPHRREWNKEVIIATGNFGQRSRREVQAFFQTWLYFGLLGEVFRIGLGVNIDLSLFVYERGKHPFVLEYSDVWPQA
jgi:hypothetical protein